MTDDMTYDDYEAERLAHEEYLMLLDPEERARVEQIPSTPIEDIAAFLAAE